MTTIDAATFAALQEAAGEEFVAELVRTFLEEAPRMVEQLIAAMADNDAEKFRRTAHSLKSNSLTFGATRLADLARQLEVAGMERVIAEDAAALQTLGLEYRRVAAALQELIGA